MTHILHLLLLFSVSIITIESQITNYNNLYGTSLTFVYYKGYPSVTVTYETIGVGYGPLNTPLSPSYGDSILYIMGNKSYTNDVIFGTIFINSECYGAITSTVSNLYAISSVTPIPSGYNTIQIGINLFSIQNYGTSPLIGPTSNNTECSAGYMYYRSFFNQYTADVRLVITDNNNHIIKNVVVVANNGIDVDSIYITEAYTFSFLAQDGSGYGAVGSIWYTSSNTQFSGIFLSTLTRKFSSLDMYSNYRFTLTTSDLIFTHV